MKGQIYFIMKECVFMAFNNFKQPIAAYKRHPESLLSGHRLHAKRCKQFPKTKNNIK